MVYHVISRLISALILGGLLATFVYLDDVKSLRLGSDAYLVQQQSRYDGIVADGGDLAQSVFVGILMAVAVFGIYEFMSFGIAKAMVRFDKRSEYDEDNS